MCLEVMSLPDLVKAKRTQRDKDWLMIRRLIEAHYAKNQENPTTEQVRFWLQESCTASMLLALSQRYPEQGAAGAGTRPLLSLALSHDESGLVAALQAEEKQERDKDRTYWMPLRKELEEDRKSVV